MRNLKRLYHEVKGYWKVMLLIGALTLLSAAFGLPGPLIVRYLIDHLIKHQQIDLRLIFLPIVGIAVKAAHQITAWEHQYNYCSGKWVQTDYNFETPSASLQTSADTLTKVGGNDKFEVFDYPGRYGKAGDGTPMTKVRMEAEEAGYDVVRADSNYSTFTPGGVGIDPSG